MEDRLLGSGFTRAQVHLYLHAPGIDLVGIEQRLLHVPDAWLYVAERSEVRLTRWRIEPNLVVGSKVGRERRLEALRSPGSLAIWRHAAGGLLPILL